MPNFSTHLWVGRYYPLLGVMQTTSLLVVMISDKFFTILLQEIFRFSFSNVWKFLSDVLQCFYRLDTKKRQVKDTSVNETGETEKEFYDDISIYSAIIRDARALDHGGPHAGRDPRKRLDGRAQRHRHLRRHARDEAAQRHRHGRGVQFPRRSCNDAFVTKSSGNDI